MLAARKLDYLRMDEKERHAYDDYMAYLGYELGLLDTAKADGRAEGKAEGRTEEKWTIAGNLFSIEMRVDDIAKVTGLSVEEIKKINPL